MTSANPYAVPLGTLLGIRVGPDHQVQEQPSVTPALDAALWGGALQPGYGGGAGGGAGGGGGGGGGCD
jgi:hypothetical protein